MMGLHKKLLGPKLEGTTLREVVRWKGADPRTRANREPWKWDEHGLAMASPRRAANCPWRSSRQRREGLRQQREGGASQGAAVPHDLVTADVVAHNPGLSEVQLRRAASYCGCSRRRFAAYLEEFARQDATDQDDSCGLPVSSVVAEHCVEQEELVATGRYVREVGPVRTPTRRRRKPSLVTRACEPNVPAESDQEQTDQAQDDIVPGDPVCAGLTELGEASWAGTEHSVNDGLLVLGDDGQPESYHALKHVETQATQLLPTGDQESTPEPSSDSSCEEEQSDAKPIAQSEMQLDAGGETEAELESLVGTQSNDGGGIDGVVDCATAADGVGWPSSPIQAYLRLERRPKTSAHAHHDHEKAEVAFAQLRAQLANLKQRPHTSPLSSAAVGRATASAPVPIWAAKKAGASETAQGCTPMSKGVSRKTVDKTAAVVPLVTNFGGMPAVRTAGNYRRGRSGISSPSAGIGGSVVIGDSATSTKAPVQVKGFGRSTSPAANSIATPPSSPPNSKPQPLKVATVGNACRGCVSLDPVYRSLSSTRTTDTGAPSPSAASPIATPWMSLSAPSLPSSSAVPVDIQARVVGSYSQSGQSILDTRLARAAARGALSRQRQAVGAAVQNALTVRGTHSVYVPMKLK